MFAGSTVTEIICWANTWRPPPPDDHDYIPMILVHSDSSLPYYYQLMRLTCPNAVSCDAEPRNLPRRQTSETALALHARTQLAALSYW